MKLLLPVKQLAVPVPNVDDTVHEMNGRIAVQLCVKCL